MSRWRWIDWLNPFRWSRDSRQGSAAVLICWGLMVQAFTLPWAHPIAFSIFLGGGFLVLVGILLYLSTLLFPELAVDEGESGPEPAAPAAKVAGQ